jgi:hypothetical protein
MTLLVLAVLMATATAAVPTGALASDNFDAVLYELTENMAVSGTSRTATASLQGWAKAGTPLCPDVLIDTLRSHGLVTDVKTCSVTAVGSDAVDLTTGTGTLWGTFAVVLNLDNAVDPAEYVVMTGRFHGGMQLLGADVPLIQIPEGWFEIDDVLGYPAAAFGLGSVRFTGMFRLPFAPRPDGEHGDGKAAKRGYYLSDSGHIEKAHVDELALGAATVRVEVTFAP